MRKQLAAGFTLVEITVVITVMIILMAIILPVFYSATRSRDQQTCMENLRVIGSLLIQYRLDHDVYPAAPLPAYLRSLDPESIPFSSVPYKLSPVTFAGIGEKEGLSVSGIFKGTRKTRYLLEIDATGDPDTFRWSVNNGAMWNDAGVPITGVAQPLGFGVSVTFAEVTGHATADSWSFYASPINTGWGEEPAARLTRLRADANSNETQISVESTVGLHAGMHLLLRDTDPKSRNVETAVIESIDADAGTITLTAGLRHPFVIGSYCDPRVGNFGLATLYFDHRTQRQGVKQFFHCPELDETQKVDQGANVRAVSEDGSLRTVDPLMAGYNTYDVTYNYDQYDADIAAYDLAMGYGDLNRTRRLGNPDAPIDTVVCWCYGHRPIHRANYSVPDLTQTPPLPDVFGSEADAAFARQQRRNDRALILWADGTVGAMSPTLARRKDDYNGQPAYQWIPPFLYAPGDMPK